jgi:hypothetical protein
LVSYGNTMLRRTAGFPTRNASLLSWDLSTTTAV